MTVLRIGTFRSQRPGDSVKSMNRVADIHLRGKAGVIRARIYWPAAASARLLVLFDRAADSLCRSLCTRAHVVVLAVDAEDVHDAVTVLEWSASHAAELGADPARLLIAGTGAGADIATAVALHACDERWPVIASVITVGDRYADQLRQAGVEVEILRHPDDLLDTLIERTGT